MSSRRAFTLIELLVVIAIIGILSSIVLASLNTARNKAQYAAVASELRSTEKALNLVFLEYGCWPAESTNSCSAALGANPSIASLILAGTLNLDDYLPRAPAWPFSAQQWKYDNDSDTHLSTCTDTDASLGVNVFLSSATQEQFERLNAIFDGDANATTATARYCGKVRLRDNGDLMFSISNKP